jgi:hypothetical protein
MSGQTHVAGVILNKDNTAIMTGTDGFYNGGLLIGWRITHYMVMIVIFYHYFLFCFLSAPSIVVTRLNPVKHITAYWGFFLWKEQFIL